MVSDLEHLAGINFAGIWPRQDFHFIKAPAIGLQQNGFGAILYFDDERSFIGIIPIISAAIDFAILRAEDAHFERFAVMGRVDDVVSGHEFCDGQAAVASGGRSKSRAS